MLLVVCVFFARCFVMRSVSFLCVMLRPFAGCCGVLWFGAVRCALLRCVVSCCGILRYFLLDGGHSFPVLNESGLMRLLATFCGLLRMFAGFCESLLEVGMFWGKIGRVIGFVASRRVVSAAG